MAGQRALTVHIPVTGEVLLRFSGATDLHKVGDFTQDIPVIFDPGAGRVGFQFTDAAWENIESRRTVGGRDSDPLDTPGRAKSTHDIVWGLLGGALGEFPSDLAERICAELDREGRLRA